MKVIQGTHNYLAATTTELFTPKLTQLDLLSEKDSAELMGNGGFIQESLDFVDDMNFHIAEMTDIYSGSADKIYLINDIKDVPFCLGKQMTYLMCQPDLKEAYLNEEMDVPAYDPPNKKLGDKDPYYRAVYSGVLKPTHNGFIAKEWLTGKSEELTVTEQLTMVANHRLVINNFDDIYGYMSASGDIDISSDGEEIVKY